MKGHPPLPRFFQGIRDWPQPGTDYGTDLNESLTLHPAQGNLAESAFLPDAGFVLHDRPTEELALREARARNNIVFELAVEPPEAAEDPT